MFLMQLPAAAAFVVAAAAAGWLTLGCGVAATS